MDDILDSVLDRTGCIVAWFVFCLLFGGAFSVLIVLAILKYLAS